MDPVSEAKMRFLCGLIGSLLGAVLLAGCAVRPIVPALPHYEPDTGYRWSARPTLPDNDPKTLLVLAFSGGGTRAAAFSYGVLEELRRTPVGLWAAAHSMLSEVDIISSVSGGSFTALACALYGERLFDHYEQQFLKRDYGGACGYRDPPWVEAAIKPPARAWPGNRALQRYRAPQAYEDGRERPYIHLVDGGSDFL